MRLAFLAHSFLLLVFGVVATAGVEDYGNIACELPSVYNIGTSPEIARVFINEHCHRFSSEYKRTGTEGKYYDFTGYSIPNSPFRYTTSWGGAMARKSH